MGDSHVDRVVSPGQGRPRRVVAAVSDAGRAKRLFAEAYDAAAASFARSADRLVYTYLARPLARALAGSPGPVLDVAAGSGALGRLLPSLMLRAKAIISCHWSRARITVVTT